MVERFVFLALLACCVLAEAQTTGSIATLPQSGPAVTAPVSADFNGDGLPDLAVHTGNAIAVYFGHGDNTFGAPIVTPLTTPETRTLFHAVATADFNGDHKQDLVAFGLYFQGNGDGTFQPPIKIPLVHHLTITDWDYIGSPDLAGYTDSGSYEVSLGEDLTGSIITLDSNPKYAYVDPDILYGPSVVIASGGPTGNGRILSLGSVQAPGDPLTLLPAWQNLTPTVVAAATGGLSVYRLPYPLSADPYPNKILAAQSIPVPTGTLLDIASIDMNGDGNPDLAIVYTSESNAFVGYYPSGNAYGAFVQIDTFTLSSPAADVGFAVVDWNTDRRSDLLLESGDSVRLYLSSLPAAVSSANLSLKSVSPGSLATLFGSGYPTKTAAALVPSKTLGDIQLNVRDASGEVYLADLLYVSPHQINFRIPEATAVGSARIEIVNISDPAPKGAAIGQADVKASAPSVFSCPPGTNTLIATAETDNGYAEPTDICGNVRFALPARITFYGTGFVGATRENTRVAVLGQSAEPLYVGPAESVPGLDKIVIRVETPSEDGDPYASLVSITVDGHVVGAGYTPIY